jgi:hypothetical protein
MTEAEKLLLIRKIVDIQTANQNNDDGDRNLADAYLSMEAIDEVLYVDEPTANPSGALRQYLEVTL